jgi:hypothetical protein
MNPLAEQQLAKYWKVGYAADPAIDILLDKSRIAQIKIRQLELVMRDLEAQLELAKMEIKMLQEEYKLR